MLYTEMNHSRVHTKHAMVSALPASQADALTGLYPIMSNVKYHPNWMYSNSAKQYVNEMK